MPAILSEANSVSCGGVSGVSDSTASAVWAVRFVLSALTTGFREVRFHSSGNSYDPFVVRGAEVLARPLAGAISALNRWMAPGATVHTVRGVHELLATAIRQPAGGVVLILDNERPHARPVVLHAAGNVGVEGFLSGRAGSLAETLAPTHSRIKLSIPANSVYALSFAP
jgi:hypothetical protein